MHIGILRILNGMCLSISNISHSIKCFKIIKNKKINIKKKKSFKMSGPHLLHIRKISNAFHVKKISLSTNFKILAQIVM